MEGQQRAVETTVERQRKGSDPPSKPSTPPPPRTCSLNRSFRAFCFSSISDSISPVLMKNPVVLKRKQNNPCWRRSKTPSTKADTRERQQQSEAFLQWGVSTAPGSVALSSDGSISSTSSESSCGREHSSAAGPGGSARCLLETGVPPGPRGSSFARCVSEWMEEKIKAARHYRHRRDGAAKDKPLCLNALRQRCTKGVSRKAETKSKHSAPSETRNAELRGEASAGSSPGTSHSSHSTSLRAKTKHRNC